MIVEVVCLYRGDECGNKLSLLYPEGHTKESVGDYQKRFAENCGWKYLTKAAHDGPNAPGMQVPACPDCQENVRRTLIDSGYLTQ